MSDPDPASLTPPTTSLPRDPLTTPPAESSRDEVTLDQHSPAAIAPPPGARFGDYELAGELARGGMGIVYKAKQIALNRVVALKMILAGQFASAAEVHRFRSEAEKAASLDHPNIVPIYEVGDHAGQHYYSMKLIDGGSLAEHLTRLKNDPQAAVRLLVTVARAVHYAHAHGILHRDLKPANILLDSQGQPHVIDFGLAKRAAAPSGGEGPTLSGAIVGTPSYMAPEQAGGQTRGLTTAVDVYSLGAILYALLTGRAPFTAETTMETLLAVLNDEPAPPRRWRPDLPSDLEIICLKCLRKEPARRYSSAGDLADDLERFLAGEPIRARAIGRGERLVKWVHRRPAAAALLGVVFLTVLGGLAAGGWFIQRLRQERDTAEKAEQAKTDALVEAERAQRAAQTRVIESQTDLGLFAGDQRKNPQAALWFAGAAELSRDDPQRRQANLVRFRVFNRINPRPLRAFHAGEGVETMAFDPTERYLLALTKGGKLLVHDLEQDALLPWVKKLGHVEAATWSPDGRTLAVAERPDRVTLYRFPDGAVRRRVPFGRPANALAFNPAGGLLAVGGPGGFRVWNDRTEQFGTRFYNLSRGLLGFVWNPHKVQVLTFGRDNQARLLDVVGEVARLVWRMPHLYQPGASLSPYQVPPVFSPDGLRVLLVPAGNQVRCLSTEKPEALWEAVLRATAGSLAISPDGAWWAAGGDLFAQLYSLQNGSPVGREMRHRHLVMGLHFTADRLALVTICYDRLARWWSVPDGESLAGDMIHQDAIDRRALAPRRDLHATAQLDGVVRVWHRRRPALAPGPFVHLAGVDGVALDASFRYAGAISRTKRLLVCALKTGEPAGPLLAAPGLVHAAALHPTREHIVAGCSATELRPNPSQPGEVQCWNWRTGRPVFGPLRTPSPPVSLAHSPTGDRIIVACTGGQLLLLDSTTGRILKEAMHPAPAWWYLFPTGIEFSPDGQSFATSGIGFSSAVWDLAGFRPRFSLAHKNHCSAARYSPDGKLLLTASVDKTARLWDAATGAPVGTPLAHPDWVFDAVFRPDGEAVATSGRDGCIRLWDWRNNALLCPVSELKDEAFQLHFTRDGRSLISICRNHTVQVWDARTGRPLSPAFPLGQGIAADRFGAPWNDYIHARIHLTPDGRRAVLGSFGVLDLEDFLDGAGAEDGTGLKRQAELVAGQTVHPGGGIVTMTSAEWLDRWRQAAQRPGLPSPQRHPAVIPLPAGDGPAPAPGVLVLRLDEPYRKATPEQIAQWIKELGTERSRAAMNALVEVGPDAIAPLRRALAAASPESRSSLQAALDGVTAAGALRPKRFHLKFEKASLPSALEALSKQSGVRLVYSTTKEGPPGGITLELKGATFWEALDRLARQAGLTWRYTSGELLLAPGKPANRTTCTGPFHLHAKGWWMSQALSPAASLDYLTLNCEVAGEPLPGLLTVGLPRITEARTSAGEELQAIPPSYVYRQPFRPLFPLYHTLRFQLPPKRGGTLERLRGVLPVEVATEPRTMLSVKLPEKLRVPGRLYPVENGGLLHLRTVTTRQGQVTIGMSMPSNALWAYEPAAHRFELTDAEGRRYPLQQPLLYPIFGQLRPADGLLLMTGSPAAGLTAVPWSGIGLHRQSPRHPAGWSGTLTFSAPQGVGPPARLTLQQIQRTQVEVPFEFRKLPLP
jgi:WD40 repeat protein